MTQKIDFVSTAKEKEILHYLLTVKVATFAQIRRAVFKNIAKSAVSKRIQRLWKAKLISKGITDLGGKMTQFYCLHPHCAEAMFSDRAISEPARLQAQSNSIEHDLILADVRECFRTKAIVKKYWTENELQCFPESAKDLQLMPFVHLHSDALMRIASDGKLFLIPIELEVSRKANDRYASKIKHYYDRGDLLSVLFIAGSTALREGVMKIEEEVREGRRPIFFYALIDDVLREQSQVEFKNLNGDRFQLM